jgi:ABC-type transport system substrate-binding protein
MKKLSRVWLVLGITLTTLLGAMASAAFATDPTPDPNVTGALTDAVAQAKANFIPLIAIALGFAVIVWAVRFGWRFLNRTVK